MTANPQSPTSWSQHRRLQFIDFRLRWDGQLNRSDLTEFFSISVPQASLDLATYKEVGAGNLRYDGSSKTYRAASTFAPVYGRSSGQRYLNELLALRTGVVDAKTTFLGWTPPVESVPRPVRAIDDDVLARVVQAIRNSTRVAVRYQAMKDETPTERELSPHALAYDGFRWHVRAYCHLRRSYRDFLFARLVSLEAAEGPGEPGSNDEQWHRMLELVLTPHPDLSPGAKRAIELDYGMQEGEVRLSCRHALLFYALRNLRLESESSQPPQAQQVVLKNRAALQLFIDQVSGGG